MTGIPLRVAGPTGMYRRSLRRFVFSSRAKCSSAWGYRNATVETGDVTEAEHSRVSGETGRTTTRAGRRCAPAATSSTTTSAAQRQRAVPVG